MIEAIFLDRDGTIGGSNEIQYPGDFQLFPQAKQAIIDIKKQNIPLFSFTNQPDIAKGKVKKSDFICELLDLMMFTFVLMKIRTIVRAANQGRACC